jgi:hypothetical protein
LNKALKKSLYKLRKKVSRSEWVIKLFDLPLPERTSTEPGLILVQIDGLSYSEFEKALEKNRLPFLRHLLAREGFTLAPFYSGMPSATPAVQAELFFGVKTAVPAFQFYRRPSGENCIMYHPRCVNRVAEALETEHKGLLKGGASYGNVFAGGATEARYCAQTLNLESFLKAANPIKVLLVLLSHVGKVLRILGLVFVELGLALVDFFSGIVERKNFFKELKFVPTRVGICIVLRELIRMRLKIDALRGVPVIHADFIGYDEQAHRRGPSSAFAHWTLQGIDGAVKDIYRAALRSEYRTYQIIFHSDHGQEDCASYELIHGRAVNPAIAEVFSQGTLSNLSFDTTHSSPTGVILKRRRRSLIRKGETRLRSEAANQGPIREIKVAAMGPLGHIYLPTRISNKEKERYAEKLVKQAEIPLVLYDRGDSVIAFNGAGPLDLYENRERILGRDHPFLDVVAEDLARLCRHHDSGDFVISGRRPGKKPVSFPIENGAHGGPGTEETRGFILMPKSAVIEKPFLRPLDLREIALALIGETG